MTVTVMELLGPYKMGDPIVLLVENHSDFDIMITFDQQVRILRSTDQENYFEPLENKMDCISPTLLLESKEKEFTGSALRIDPEIENQGKQ